MMKVEVDKRLPAEGCVMMDMMVSGGSDCGRKR